jgi:hypothetical protein
VIVRWLSELAEKLPLLLALSMIAAPPPRGGGALAQGALKITIGKLLDKTLSKEGQQAKNAMERAYQGHQEISGACEAWDRFLQGAANAVAQENDSFLLAALQDNFEFSPSSLALVFRDKIYENLMKNPQGSVAGLSEVRFRLNRTCHPPSLDGDWTSSSAGGGSVCTLEHVGDKIIARYAELNDRMVNEFDYRSGDICFEGTYDGNTLDGQYDGRGIFLRGCKLVPMEPTAYTLERVEKKK